MTKNRTKAQKRATKINFAHLRIAKVKKTLEDIMREYPEVFQSEMNRDETWIIERILMFKDALKETNEQAYIGLAAGKDYSAVMLVERWNNNR